MDQLLSKVTNLGYEILGIFFPGVVLILFAIFGWWCLGPMAEVWSQGFLPTAGIVQFSGFLSVLNERIQAGMLGFLLVAAYFCGHLLHWLSRRGEREAKVSGARRVLMSLIFRVPKPATDFHEGLERLFVEAKKFFELDPDAKWREYYPLAKSYLGMNLQTSLAPTFQTKYTLHRSLTIASAIWFWGSAFGIVLSLITMCAIGADAPKWIPLVGSLFASCILIWGFSDTYRYNWLLWGDTLIAEICMIQSSKKK